MGQALLALGAVIFGAAASTVGAAIAKRREFTKNHRVQLYQHDLPTLRNDLSQRHLSTEEISKRVQGVLQTATLANKRDRSMVVPSWDTTVVIGTLQDENTRWNEDTSDPVPNREKAAAAERKRQEEIDRLDGQLAAYYDWLDDWFSQSWIRRCILRPSRHLLRRKRVASSDAAPTTHRRSREAQELDQSATPGVLRRRPVPRRRSGRQTRPNPQAALQQAARQDGRPANVAVSAHPSVVASSLSWRKGGLARPRRAGDGRRHRSCSRNQAGVGHGFVCLRRVTSSLRSFGVHRCGFGVLGDLASIPSPLRKARGPTMDRMG